MKKLKKMFRSITVFSLSAPLLFGSFLGGGPGTINQLDQWRVSNGAITQNVANRPIKITGVTTGGCLTLDSNSILSQTTCGDYSDEDAQDAVGSILIDSTEIDFVYNDSTPSITASLISASIAKSKLDAGVNASLSLADSSLQPANISDTAYDATSWNGVTTIAPSKNAIRDKIDTMDSAIALNTAKVTNATHTGDVTGATALTIADDAVTYAKIQNVVGDNVILGNNSGAGGIVDELSASEVRTILNVADGATANVGTVTSVSATVPTGLTISGSPITSSGTLAIGLDTGYVIPQSSQIHDAVTVTDSTEIDFTLTGQDITAVLKSGSIDETKLDTSVNSSLDLADSALQPNTPITGATKTKITYDADGLVTAGADATTADINDSSNRRYVTDAQLTVIGNTSGTNTGDQDLSGYLTSATASSTYQPLDADLTAIAGLSSADSNIIVGSATGWVAESGDTARTSLGLGTGDSPTFTGQTLSGLTASRVVVTDGSKALASSAVTATELGYLSGATSSVQDQLDSKVQLDYFTITETTGITDELVGRWNFEEGAGSIATDTSPIGTNVGTINGATYTTGIKGNYALDFNGSSDYVTLGTGLSQTGAFSITANFNVSSLQNAYIISKAGSSSASKNYYIFIASDGSIEAGPVDSLGSVSTTVTSAGAYSAGQNNNVIVTYDGSTTVKIYVNGILVKENASWTGTLASSSQEVFIGRRLTTYFDGVIDDVRLYTKELDSIEIAKISGGAIDSSTILNDIEARYLFEEGTGSTASDSSGNSNTLNLNNGATFSTGKIGSYALSLDGSNDFANDSSTTGLNNTTYTFAGWIKPSSLVDKAIIGLDNHASNKGFLLSLTSAGNIALNTGASWWGYSTSGANIIAGEWAHIAFSITSGGNVKLFVNGVALTNVSSSGDTQYSTSAPNLVIGADYDTNIGGSYRNFFPGSMDDLRLYSRALDDSEIYLLYNNGLTEQNQLVIGSPSNSYIQYIDEYGNVGFNTNDLDGTPATGIHTIKGLSNDGSTNILVGRDGDEANVFSLDTNGEIISDSLTASRALVSGSNKEIESSNVTATELGYLSGVTSAIQTQLGNKQPLDSGLTSIAGLTTSADKMIYTTASDTYAVTDLTAFARSILDDANEATFKATVNLEIGTDVQAYSAILAGTTASFTTALETKLNGIEALADVTDTANVTSAGALMDSELADITAIKTLQAPDNTTISTFGASLIDDTDASTARTTLGLAIGTNVQAYNAGLADIAGLAKTDGNIIVGNGTNWVAESGATARTSLGLAIGTNVQAYSSILANTTASFLTAQETKLGYISVTQAVNLDTMESDIATNNAKVTNATHTGQVTGATTLTLDKTAISDQSSATIATDDTILIGDTSATNALKKVTAQSIADLYATDATTSVKGRASFNTLDFTVSSGAVSVSNPLKVMDFRLTLTSNTPVLTSDVTGASTLYLTPYTGNQISLYNGSRWVLYETAEISLSLSGYTTGKPYDIWAYDNSGTITLDSTVWTNDSTRATALARQNGVYVKTGDATRRYVGTIYTSGTGTTEMSFGGASNGGTPAKLFVYNYYNRVDVTAVVQERTDTWTYAGTTWRSYNNSSGNRVDFIIGVSEDTVTGSCIGNVLSTTFSAFVGIGLDSTSAISANSTSALGTAGALVAVQGTIAERVAVGKHSMYFLENGNGGYTHTFFGDAGAPNNIRSGLFVKTKM